MGSTSEDITVTPYEPRPGSKANFGAIVTGVDLNNLSDDTINKLREAIWKHKLVVVKNTLGLEPMQNWQLLRRLDPNAKDITQEEFGRLFSPTGEGIIAKLKLATIPDAGHIHLIGKGYQGDDHYGLKKLNLVEAFAGAYYSKELKEEDFENGVARFQSWHIDGPMYKVDVPKFSSFRVLKVPVGPDQTVEWADGSGMSMKVKPGRTAFVSSLQIYDLLSPEEKEMADNSWVENMFYPYEWLKGARGAPNGLGVANEGRETPDEEMAAIEGREESWTRKYPMVWKNPVTGEKAFQVQQNTARRLYIKASPESKVKVIDDVTEVRKFLNNIQSRVILPEYILSEPAEEGDLLLWSNWSVMHSKVDYPLKYGPRIAHQGWIPSSDAPQGPTAIEV